MQRTVLRTTEQLLGSEELFFFSFGQGKVREAFPEIIDRRDGGMDQVGGIPAIVPQFVQQDLVCREIIQPWSQFLI